MPLRRVERWIALALLATCTSVAMVHSTATAQEGTAGIQISPTRVEEDIRDRDFSATVTFLNREPEERRLRVRVTGLGHDLDGVPAFVEPSPAIDHVQLQGETDFVLQPNESRRVSVRGSIPRNEPSIYFAVVARYERPGDEGQVQIRSQVASLFLIRGPKPWRQTVEIVDVGVKQPTPEQEEAGGPYTLFAAAENTGNVHFEPSGEIEVFKDGELVDVVDLPGEAVIPTFARRVVGTWEPDEVPDGIYQLEATLKNPSAKGSGEVEFFDGRLSLLAAEIFDLQSADAGVRFNVVNVGSLPVTPTVHLNASADGVEAAAETIPIQELAPGTAQTVEWQPDLGPGTYAVDIELRSGDELLDQDAAGIQIAGFPWLWPALGAAFLVLLLLLLLFWRRRRRDRQPRQPRRAPKPVAAAKPVPQPRPPGVPPPPPPPPPKK